jgi:tetratricopeptide (TPR) repeat protein
MTIVEIRASGASHLLAKRDLPPKTLPRRLSADEYFLLSVQYLLIGSLRLSLKAAIKAMSGHSAYGRQFVSLYCTRTGAHFTKLTGIQYHLVWLGFCGLDCFLGVVVPSTKFVWTAAGNVSETWGKVGAKLNLKSGDGKVVSESSDQFDLLPKAIARVSLPEGLSADDYLKLGKQYKQNGWISLSQDSLKRAQELAPGTQTATSAMQYLQTKVPKVRVPLEVEHRNIQGYQYMAKGELEKTRQVFEGLMQEYPDFEWPYLNLATAYQKDGQLEKAKFLLRKLLSINPDHVEAWDVLARIYTAEFDLPEAQNAIARAQEVYPEEENNMKTIIECLAALN